MNKIIFTNDRMFMAVVGPSGSGKSELIYKMLKGGTFSPPFEKIYFFYQEYQPLYDQMQTTLNIEFIPCINFEMIKNLENCLLIFDDSCEEIYQDKNFVKIATSARHRKVHVIYVKHNLYQQSKTSRTIDLNTTHLVLFKSPRDIQQIAHFGKQLNKSKFIKDCFESATEEAFGHLLIDLDPRTSDSLRYCSNIVGPEPTIFYLPSSKAVVTEITNEREKIGYSQRVY